MSRSSTSTAAALALAAGVSILVLVPPPALARPPALEEIPSLAEPRPVTVPLRLSDAEGRPLASAPEPGALAVRDDGSPRRVAELAPAGDFAEVVVYFDLGLLSPAELGSAAYLLADDARALTELGPVRLVTRRPGRAGDGAATVLPATRDPQALVGTLTFLATGGVADDELRRHRRRWLERSFDLYAADGAASRPEALPALGDDPAGTAAAVARDEEIVAGHREALLLWAADTAAEAGTTSAADRLLVLVTGGHDADPRTFYRSALEAFAGEEGTRTAAELAPPLSLPTTAEVGRVLAATGWTVLALRPAGASALLGGAGPAEGETRALPEPTPDRTGTGTGPPPSGIAVDLAELAELWRRRRAAAEENPRAALERVELLAEPQAPLADLAAATGGETAGTAASLAAALERLASRYRLTFEAPPDAVDGLRSLAVEPPSGVRVAFPGWWTATPPETVAALRARRLLADPPGAAVGMLEVDAAFAPAEVGPGRLTIRVAGPDGPDAASGGRRRVTVARYPSALAAATGAGPAGGAVIVSHAPLPDGEGPHELEIAAPAAADGEPMAVLVEELGSGRWGATLAAALPATTGVAGGALDDFLPAPRAVHLLAPREPFLVGRTRFEALVSDRRTERLELRLDGERVASLDAPPWQATVELGELPHPRRLEAVAYGPGGVELGRDRLTLNQGAGAFRVRITAPAPAPGEEILGTFEVAAEVAAPADARVERVDFYRGDDRVASRFAPPWRQRMERAGERAAAYVRVVARLADGRVAEDVVFLDGERSGERLEVDLVELFVVVEDAAGRPVPGLPEEAFRVYEAGERQAIDGFREGADVPLTVGLAIDSSASMFAKLPRVATAAAQFVHTSLDADDRALVVGFGGRPALAHAATADRARLTGALASLRADGLTAFWEGMVYALVELQGLPGKKALVVYSDGADEDEDFSYRTALRFARRVGVPVYVILTNNEIRRTNGRALSVRGFLGRIERLVEATGGRVYLSTVGADLDAVYRQIGDELRRQYLLTYYPSTGATPTPESEWRRVRVELAPPAPAGARVRTLAGYYR